mmetsp:Transcript_4780/g.11231  ORF Transcript_4780/g.11231 Transcript_4780/m.11231 type:complete len:158 (-) Transcript_4780:114-587(-)
MSTVLTSASSRRRGRCGGLAALLLSVLAACNLCPQTFVPPTHSVRIGLRAAGEAPALQGWGSTVGVTGSRATHSLTALRIFGLGTSELLVILAVAVLFFGPEALKGVAKEAGKAAADLKDVPKAFEEGMETAAAAKALDAGEAKIVDAKVEKEAKEK